MVYAQKNQTGISYAALLLGALSCLLFFIIGIAVGYEYGTDNILDKDSLSSWIAAISTLFIAILTCILALETIRLRTINQMQIDKIRLDSIRPNVIFRIDHNPAAYHFLDIHIENTGEGIAYEVRFELENLSENSVEVFEYIMNEITHFSMIKRGIKSLGRNEIRQTSLVNIPFFKLHDKFGDNLYKCSFSVKVDFCDSEGNSYPNEFIVDFSEFENKGQLGGGDPLYQMAKSFNTLTDQYSKIITNNGKLNVELHSENHDASKQIYVPCKHNSKLIHYIEIACRNIKKIKLPRNKAKPLSTP